MDRLEESPRRRRIGDAPPHATRRKHYQQGTTGVEPLFATSTRGHGAGRERGSPHASAVVQPSRRRHGGAGAHGEHGALHQ